MEQTGEKLKNEVQNDELTSDEIDKYYNDNKITLEKSNELKTMVTDQATKEREENKNLYSENMKSIENKHQDFKVSEIDGKNNDKTILLHIGFSNNKNDLYRKCAELVVDEENNFKNIGIKKIMILVDGIKIIQG